MEIIEEIREETKKQHEDFIKSITINPIDWLNEKVERNRREKNE